MKQAAAILAISIFAYSAMFVSYWPVWQASPAIQVSFCVLYVKGTATVLTWARDVLMGASIRG